MRAYRRPACTSRSAAADAVGPVPREVHRQRIDGSRCQTLADDAAAQARDLRHQLEAVSREARPGRHRVAWPHLNSSRPLDPLRGPRGDRASGPEALDRAGPRRNAHDRGDPRDGRPGPHGRQIAAAQDRRQTQLAAAGAADRRPTHSPRPGPMPWPSSAWASPTRPRPKRSPQRLAPLFPNQSEHVNRELAAVLVYLEVASRRRARHEAAGDRSNAGRPAVLRARPAKRRQLAYPTTRRRPTSVGSTWPRAAIAAATASRSSFSRFATTLPAKLTDADRDRTQGRDRRQAEGRGRQARNDAAVRPQLADGRPAAAGRRGRKRPLVREGQGRL